ncbi:MAG: CRISPR-associated protein Csx11 [Methanothrix sp.]|nr:CRISPR-associated protein Csx11 [Methanothrix sp.]
MKVLEDKGDALLLAEVIAMLHDLGKLSSQFIDQMSCHPSQQSQQFEHEKAILQSGFVDNKFMNVLKKQRLRNQLRWSEISNRERIGQLCDMILHHDSTNHSSFLVRLLNRCDGADSGADKGTTRQAGLPQEAKQPSDKTFIANAFGSEQQRIDGTALDNVRIQLSMDLGIRLTKVASQRVPLSQVYADILENIERSFRSALGETRRAANDVTLWDHSFSVATLYKMAIATFLLNGSLDINHLRWRLLRVNFDVLGLYAKAIKIADLLGYQQAVETACVEVKQLVEEEYPLGNEVYRDTTGIYFTFPDLDFPADLAQEIRRRVEGVEMELAPRIVITVGDGATAAEQLKGILGKARKEALDALAQPFDSQNLSACWQQQWTTVGAGQWEVCPVCRLRPMKEGQEACETCMNRRGSRVQEWLGNPRTTIWIDEIADHNDRVALVVGKFGLDDWLSGDLVQTMLVKAIENNPNDCVPKNPSPARLRRVWETCQRFWSETVMESILAGKSFGGGDVLRCMRVAVVPDDCKGWQENVPYDGTINGRAVSLLWQESEKRFITIINLQLGVSQAWDEVGLIGEWHGRICTVSILGKPGQTRTFTVQQVQSLNGEPIQIYAPYLSLLESPDCFLALVPAAEAPEIADKIRDEYQKQFRKVQNRLPLFLGIVFFPRKLPLMAVMDAARRMLNSKFVHDEWRIAGTPQNDGKMVTLCLEQNGQSITLQISIVMGDGTTEDVWYPYFELVGTPAPHHTYRFERAGVWWVHVKTLQAGETVRVTPSRFAYLFLESTAQRFRFDPKRDVLLLDELPRLTAMWQRLKESGITMTGLRNVQALLESKGAAWGRDSEEFERLTRTTLKQAGLFERKDKDGNPLPDVITPQDVTSERFAHCLELYLHILKQKIG